MAYSHKLSSSELLEDTNIDFYGNPDIQFHINTGRTWESKTTHRYDENGDKTVVETVNTTPCPTIDVYDVGEQLEVLVHLPMKNPIIADWFTVSDEYKSFFESFIAGLEDGFHGIDEITRFNVEQGSEELAKIVTESLNSGTPDSVPTVNEKWQIVE